MNAGSILQVGTPKELFDRPQHTFVGTFIGSPGMNVLRCEFDGEAAIVDGVRVALDAGSLAAARSRDLHLATVVHLEVGVRPESLTLIDDTLDGEGVAVEILAVEDLGCHSLVRLKLGEQKLCVLHPEGVPIPEAAKLRFEPSSTLLYADSLLVQSSATTRGGAL